MCIERTEERGADGFTDEERRALAKLGENSDTFVAQIKKLTEALADLKRELLKAWTVFGRFLDER